MIEELKKSSGFVTSVAQFRHREDNEVCIYFEEPCDLELVYNLHLNKLINAA